MSKHRLTFTNDEIWVLAHITRHFADYICGDDRPDHGLGILKGYREANMKHLREHGALSWDTKPDFLKSFIRAMGKLNRFDRKLRFKALKMRKYK